MNDCHDQVVVISTWLLQFSVMIISYNALYRLFSVSNVLLSISLLSLPILFVDILNPFLEAGRLCLIKICEIHWNVAFYILNTITLCMKKYVDLFSMSTDKRQ